MDKIAKLLTIIELNLAKLGRQYKSEQAVLIVDALEALTEVLHLTKSSGGDDAERCPDCGETWGHNRGCLNRFDGR